jgi:REP element-mobilizing transposase RayT
MSVRQIIPYKSGIFFITFTCADWLPLFKKLESYDLVYKWFDVLRENKHAIHGYVIMPDHVHAIISFRNTGQPINTIVGNGKRFMAYEFVKRLELMKDFDLLLQMNLWVNDTDKKRNKKHEVFEPSFDWKDCSDKDIAEQKLNYIHMNPCNAKPPLVVNPINYLHSSANQYFGGSNIIYPVEHIMTMNDFNYE